MGVATKSYDIGVDSCVNVVVPQGFDPRNNEEHARIVTEIALRKFRHLMEIGDFNIEWDLREYEDHDPTTEPDGGV